MTEILTFVDAAHTVHDNMRSHIGGIASFGIGAVHTKSLMAKINTRSTCESELVGVSEYLPYNIWTLMFMEHQGYEMTDNVIYQDNKSAILLERNGRNSCTGNSRHISIKYFFVKDRVDKKQVRIEYLPTHLMIADYFTKPLQGTQFNVLRKYIVGWAPLLEMIIKVDQ